MKQLEKQKIAKLILYTIVKAFAESNLRGEDLPDTLPLTSLVYLAGEESIRECVFGELPQKENLEFFHDEALDLVGEDGYNYEEIFDLIVSLLTEKGVHSYDTYTDAGDPLSLLLRDIILADFGGQIKVQKTSRSHLDALVQVFGYGMFIETWSELFHTLTELLVKGKLSIK